MASAIPTHLPVRSLLQGLSMTCISGRKNLSLLMTKPRKWQVHPAKTQISLGIHPVWSVFAARMKKAWVLSYPYSTLRRLIRLGRCPGWSVLAWAHRYFVGFVMRWLISCKMTRILPCKVVFSSTVFSSACFPVLARLASISSNSFFSSWNTGNQ